MIFLRNFLISSIFLFLTIGVSAQNEISLAGTWRVALDSMDIGIEQRWYNTSFDKAIQLPGTLDDAGMGTPADIRTDQINKEVLLKLTRKHTYIGPAWYSRDVVIPKGWSGKSVQLMLERVIWNTRLWIDGREAGSSESLSVPHRFDLSQFLSPGKHRLVIRIDNRKQYDISVRDLAHAYTDGTQIIWNGVIGEMKLMAKPRAYIGSLQAYPDAAARTVTVVAKLENELKGTVSGTLQFQVLDKNRKMVTVKKISVSIAPGLTTNKITLALGKKALFWDEFTANLYTVKGQLILGDRGSDVASVRFGLREVTAKNSMLQVNGRRIFLRGTLECNIFSLTGHPPMDKRGWIKVFTSAKSYGLNHLRFHSWCPPQAAFDVADSLGFYLQIENPLWSLTVGKDSATNRFTAEEARRIRDEYGNHPSFCFWSMGNELEGDFKFLKNLVEELKSTDNRHLYTTTTFSFQKGHGTWPEPADDYFITQYTKRGWVRGQGIFNSYAPNFSTDYSKSIDSLPVPIVTHEIGQYSVYPVVDEMKKYTGVLAPRNLETIRNDLERKGLLHLDSLFLLASGKFAANLYKEEIERALKTKGLSGFQLLDLHDFPGQGTALVGMLDAFWDSKGLVTPADHRMYCAAVVPLVRFEKATYRNDEIFHATAEVANFSNAELKNVMPTWTIRNRTGRTLYSGILETISIPVGNGIGLGKIDVSLAGITGAEELTLEMHLKGTVYRNEWKFWVYPAATQRVENDVVYTRSPDEAIKLLDEGRRVLLNPDTVQLKGVEGRFAPVFWSPVHFPDQPGTMGILCDAAHPAFKYFPTDFYSGWQWWDLIASSKTMIIDSLPPLAPVVRVIDNFFKNRKMANIIEAKIGKGKLLLCSMDLSRDIDKRPAAKQLRYSLMQYMGSSSFAPAVDITGDQLRNLLK
jgi:hypothetical protein